MNKEFKVDENSTLVEYRGTKRSFEILRGGDVISRITTWYRDNVTQVTVPGNIVKHIGFKAFKGCVDVREITLEEGVQSVELGAFWDTNLEELWMPHSMRCFSADSLPIKDKKVTLHVNYSRGAWNALKRAGFVLRKIPKNLWESYSGLFIALKMSYKRLVNLTLHVRKAEDIADREFLGMPIDCIVTFHDDIRAKYLFQRSMPSTVIIEKGVSHIVDDAFISGGEVFFEDTNIERIDVAPENPYFYSKEGVLFDRTRHALRRFPQGKILPDNKYILPGDTQEVVAGAFDGAYTIETLVIPEGVVLLENALANTPKLDAIWKEQRMEA